MAEAEAEAPVGLPSPAAVAQAVAAEGFCVLRGLLSPAEVDGIRQMLEDDDGPRKYAYRGTTKMASFPHPGDDVLGRLARSRRLHTLAAAAIAGGSGGSDSCSSSFPSSSSSSSAAAVGPAYGQEGEEEPSVQLHHVQAVFKEPRSDYAFAWHQDYGYHYHGNVLKPHMCTFVVAVDPCLPENGGLEILARSHTCGRLDHRPKDASTRQLTADPARVALLLRLPRRFPLHALALRPGDAVVFHGLTLHRSGPNASAGLRRYALNITYNRRDNLPIVTDPATAAAAADIDDEGAASTVPPPLPYAIVEDEAVAAGGTRFDPARWGVPPIPRAVHELLERWRDGGAGAAEVEAAGARVVNGSELVFVGSDRGLAEAVAFKCRALKLSWREEEGTTGELVVSLPPQMTPS